MLNNSLQNQKTQIRIHQLSFGTDIRLENLLPHQILIGARNEHTVANGDVVIRVRDFMIELVRWHTT